MIYPIQISFCHNSTDELLSKRETANLSLHVTFRIAHLNPLSATRACNSPTYENRYHYRKESLLSLDHDPSRGHRSSSTSALTSDVPESVVSPEPAIRLRNDPLCRDPAPLFPHTSAVQILQIPQILQILQILQFMLGRGRPCSLWASIHDG